jgi:hypothetical protein
MFKSFFYGSISLCLATIIPIEGLFFSKPNAPIQMATAITSEKDHENIVDKWIPVDVTQQLEILLISGLSYDLNYASNVKNHICVNKIHSIQVQMAVGVTYEYKVDACDPSFNDDDDTEEDVINGYCHQKKNCIHYTATVQVFTIPWKNTVKILQINKNI